MAAARHGFSFWGGDVRILNYGDCHGLLLDFNSRCSSQTIGIEMKDPCASQWYQWAYAFNVWFNYNCSKIWRF